MRYIIRDWAGNVCFHGEQFKSEDDAEEFLANVLNDNYETDREEYNVLPIIEDMT